MSATFNVYRSETTMDVGSMPTPVATGLTDKNYSDTTVVEGTEYYYRVGAVKIGVEKFSNEIKRSAGVLWTPLNLTTAMYFDADSVIKDGLNRISQLTDLSGNIRHATKSTDAAKPTLSTFLDGSNAILFDGTDDYLWQSNTSYLNNVAGSWVFSVELLSAKAGYTYLTSSMFNPSGVGKMSRGYNDNKVYIGGRRQSGSSYAEAIDATDTSTQQNIVFSQISFTSATASVHINGTQEALNSSFGTPGNTDSTAIHGTSIGAYVSNNSGLGFSGGVMGKVGCIIIGTGVLSSGDREKLEGWAAHKYGLTANLPIGHPYKTNPPLL